MGEIDNLLRAGNLSEAKFRLERWRHPKWEQLADCEAQYQQAMGRLP